jgi:hypothetical protein
MKTIILTAIICLIASTALGAPKLCLVWDEKQITPGGAITSETRSKIFDTVADVVAFLDKRKITDKTVTGLWELRPVAKQVITMQEVEKVEPEVIKEKRWKEIKWSSP